MKQLNAYYDITLPLLLCIILLGLKLSILAYLPWWVVLSPLWVGILLFCCVFIYFFITQNKYEDHDQSSSL